LDENNIDSKLNLTSINQFERDPTEKFNLDINNSKLLTTLNNNITFVNENILST
jgi:hypothetical protein